MTVHVFFNPELVEQLTACGITARPQLPSATPRGFVLGGRPAIARGQRTVTPVIAAHGHVTITGQRRLTDGRSASTDASSTATVTTTATQPQTALDLAEECARLRRDNQRLTAEVSELRQELNRLTARPGGETDRQTAGDTQRAARDAAAQRRALDDAAQRLALDDAATRFSLLELE